MQAAPNRRDTMPEVFGTGGISQLLTSRITGGTAISSQPGGSRIRSYSREATEHQRPL
ncbi:hypothetical protein DPMN_068720 [Dreissena polymorpha]|uniref:Uncharacterized protein n=1 Tax=Dreissena polymorpha TaxID=45954 RepID=A0A9D3YY41_DREPO|nr:hypothetical protein DPMN_068720 [Dreissena polymorpha]